ncbi:MAG: cation:proton antiporter subunit C [Brachybacterium sp.]|nr:cation:proton antiporter subunit C [Brachybacterium sp.]
MIIALIVGTLFAGSVYFMLQRDRLRVILGFVLLGHAANLLLFAAGGTARREEPLGGDLDPSVTADALPQAFVLTAIVIAFAITMYLLVLAVTGRPDEDHADEPDPGLRDGARPAPGPRTGAEPVGRTYQGGRSRYDESEAPR